ncbi:MAG TPA: DUF805 domain-containing protein [Sulfurimonas sp.]|nr:DUF805 domain-containing protein [Sulfurimonas sp.]
MEYFLGAYKKYADFTGRARRKEYWMFYLFYLLAIIALVFIDAMMGSYDNPDDMGLLSTLFVLGSLIPFIALTTRRLHDINQSGWWQLIILIPLIGQLVIFVFTVFKGDPGENRFGEDPLDTSSM